MNEMKPSPMNDDTGEHGSELPQPHVPDEAERLREARLQGAEEVEQPAVPVPEGFKVGKVVRLPEDTRQREKIRQEFDTPIAQIPLTDASIDRPAASRGTKGRAKRKEE